MIKPIATVATQKSFRTCTRRGKPLRKPHVHHWVFCFSSGSRGNVYECACGNTRDDHSDGEGEFRC
jgi:hypothetical protein